MQPFSAILPNIRFLRSSAALAAAMLLPVLLNSCAGTDTIRITSDPSGADVMANGVSVGKTPVSIPRKWAGFGTVGDSTKLVLYRQGYQTTERTINNDEWWNQFWSGGLAGGSEHGFGHTYAVHMRLEPKAGSATPSPQIIYRDRHVPVPVPQKPDWR